MSTCLMSMRSAASVTLIGYVLIAVVVTGSGPALGLVSSAFRFEELSQCRRYPVLSCDDFNDLQITSWIAQGTVKNVYLADWRGYSVVLSNLTIGEYREDFLHSVAMHHLLDDAGYTVRMLGHCGTRIVTEYHPRGNLLQALALLNDSLAVRFPLCIRYAEILAFLHRHDRVMCDSNSLDKTLEQYVLTTSGSLLLNDLDALPRKVSGIVRCGNRMLDGDFIAPEQRWELGYSKGYDEKTDIYKVPDVCAHILGDSEQALWFRYWLFSLHKRCKLETAADRPSVAEIVAEYGSLWKEYQKDIDVDYTDL